MSITMHQARDLVDAAIAAARERHVLVSITVVDAHGNLLWAGKMDGAKFLGPDIARGKAYTCVVFLQTSAHVETMAINLGKSLFYTTVADLNPGRMVFGQGGLPVWSGSEIVGAIGVSGTAPEVDEEIAAAALQAAGFREPDAEVVARVGSGRVGSA